MHDDGSPARYSHRTFGQGEWRQQGALGHLSMGALFVVGTQIVVAATAACTATHGARVWKQERKNPLRQAVEQLALWS